MDRRILLNQFNLSVVFFLRIESDYNYTRDYMENIARNFTKKYPSYLIHKKSEDKIKAFLADMVKAKVETLCQCRGKERDSKRGTRNSRPDSGI